MDKYGNGSVKERCAAFDAAHGAPVSNDVWVYHPDGARREANPLGVMHEPPADPKELQKNIIRFYQISLAGLVREFDDKKRLFKDPGVYQDAERNLAELKRLQVAARRTRTKLKKAEEALHRLTPGYRTPEEEAETIRVNEAIAARKTAYVAALDAIVL